MGVGGCYLCWPTCVPRHNSAGGALRGGAVPVAWRLWFRTHTLLCTQAWCLLLRYLSHGLGFVVGLPCTRAVSLCPAKRL